MSRLPAPPPPPPRGQAAGAGPLPRERPLLVSGRLAQVAIAAQSVIAVFSAHALWARADVVRRVEQRVGTGPDALDAADLRVALTSFAHLSSYLVAGVVFLLWFHTAYANVHARRGAKHAVGWSIGAWFVPGLALWRPVKIAEELLDPRPTVAVRVVLWVWWVLWVTSMFLWSVTVAVQPTEIDDFVALDRWGAFGQVAHATGGGLLFVLVRHVTGVDDRARRTAAAAGGTTAT